MQPLIDIFLDVLTKREITYFKNFLSGFNLKNTNWYLLSDYCIGDDGKFNDVITFTLLAKHDTLENISDYINSIAPVDLKKTKKVSHEFLTYLNSPLVYHFSLVIPKEQFLLNKLITKEEMVIINSNLKFIISNTIKDKPDMSEYYSGVLSRIDMIESELNRKTFNDKLFRKMFLVGSFGASIIYYLKMYSIPKSICWVSDRDAITQKFDSYVFDYMSMMYNMQPTNEMLTQDVFNLIFEPVAEHGKNIFDQLVRIPDFIAGTLSSYSKQYGLDELRDKHLAIIFGAMLNSTNQVSLRIEFNENKLSLYSEKWI